MGGPLTYAITTRDANLLETVAHAAEAGEVALAYQPILRADTGQVAFYEGLLRIFDPAGRVIPPANSSTRPRGWNWAASWIASRWKSGWRR